MTELGIEPIRLLLLTAKYVSSVNHDKLDGNVPTRLLFGNVILVIFFCRPKVEHETPYHEQLPVSAYRLVLVVHESPSVAR